MGSLATLATLAQDLYGMSNSTLIKLALRGTPSKPPIQTRSHREAGRDGPNTPPLTPYKPETDRGASRAEAQHDPPRPPRCSHRDLLRNSQAPIETLHAPKPRARFGSSKYLESSSIGLRQLLLGTHHGFEELTFSVTCHAIQTSAGAIRRGELETHHFSLDRGPFTPREGNEGVREHETPPPQTGRTPR